ncbi:GNAT family N-acetyltransferase [Aeromicrobium terrae]|uniref:GNAT family N-acetyltransferase n=1 Tax=Aeromicrobium terrae TaxID=2498846 RepID=A0A5C8NNT4_9ACTN|nr:GNAT family N-acetyltransferase [Aeromicrobium terrae]TXL62757.1 GNAT family N-acetyltransferase [Aeromicrobium terrae]
MTDDRETAIRWVRGWAHVRDLTVETVDGWPLVHVDSASRDTEIVCVDPGRSAFATLAEHVAGDARAMLTVLADDLDPYRDVASGLRVDRDDETFMTAPLTPSESSLLGGGSPRWLVDGSRATYCVDVDGRLAAEGSVGVLGTDAVFDRIETSPDHRRRGLGRHVMATLTSWAMSEGATAGLLVASVEGAALYRSLGWDAQSSVLSLMGA